MVQHHWFIGACLLADWRHLFLSPYLQATTSLAMTSTAMTTRDTTRVVSTASRVPLPKHQVNLLPDSQLTLSSLSAHSQLTLSKLCASQSWLTTLPS